LLFPLSSFGWIFPHPRGLHVRSGGFSENR
jgi:hypothetical protein